MAASCNLLGAEVHGAMHLHEKSDYTVTTTRMDPMYDIDIGNTDEFTISAAMTGGGDQMEMVTAGGRTVAMPIQRLSGPGRVLDHQQRFWMELKSNEDITWAPEARNSRFAGYHTLCSPQKIRFDPPVILKYDDASYGNLEALGPVSELHFVGTPTIGLLLPSVRLRAQRIRIDIPDGFKDEDRFLVAQGPTPIARPQAASWKQISFIANSDAAKFVPLEMYKPTAGPHVLAFFSDARSGAGFDCNDLAIDGTHILRTSSHARAQPLRISSKWYVPFNRSYASAQMRVDIVFDEPTIYIYDLQVKSDIQFAEIFDDRLSTLARTDQLRSELDRMVTPSLSPGWFVLSAFMRTPTWSSMTVDEFAERLPRSTEREQVLAKLLQDRPLVSSLHLPIVSGDRHLVLTGLVKPTEGAELGTYEGHVVIRGANLEAESFPVKYELYDPLGPAKQTFAGVTASLITGYLAWYLFDRRRKAREAISAATEIRNQILREHYSDLIELRQRVTTMDAEIGWNEISENINWLLERRLQTLFSESQWVSFRRYVEEHNATGSIAVLREVLAGNV